MGKGLIITLIILAILITGGYFIYTNNFGFEGTQKSGVRDSQIENIDLSECLSLQGTYEGAYGSKAFECWVNLAKENKDIIVCEAGFKKQYLQSCYENVSQYFNDVSMCDGLEFAGLENYIGQSIDIKVSCYIRFANKKNWDVCENSFLKTYKTSNIYGGQQNSGSDFCYVSIVSWGNNLLGKSLTDDEIVNLCGKIIDEDLGNSCLNYVGDPFNIPQEIKDKYSGKYS